MKKIQLITYEVEEYLDYSEEIEVSNFNNLKSLDLFDINIFDLNDNRIWQNNISFTPDINIILYKDFKSINKMLKSSTKAKILFFLPQNINYCLIRTHDYYQLKDIEDTVSKILNFIIPIQFDIEYDNNLTKISNELISSSFYIINNNYEIITKAESSEKITTIKKDNIIVSTLKIIDKNNNNILNHYLNEIGLISYEPTYPEWLYSFNFFDDQTQRNNITQAKKQILIQEKIIEEAYYKLNQNLKYKSILCSTSKELITVVFEILEFIFDISLSDSKDELNEDFLIKKDNITYIGEIKGVNSNVKNEHIGQVDNHYLKYLDKLESTDEVENLKKILIINFERERDVLNRNEVHQKQIEMANKRQVLIIDTVSLLKIYEKLLNEDLSKDKVIEYINNNVGLVEINKI
ncbi:MAG: hypothetical protein GX265_00675 [Mollicutes bacterium]|nr:hypothetical protein [Mollicutes bacterium]